MLTFSTPNPTATRGHLGPAGYVILDTADTNRKIISPLLSFRYAHRHGFEDARCQRILLSEQSFPASRTAPSPQTPNDRVYLSNNARN